MTVFRIGMLEKSPERKVRPMAYDKVGRMRRFAKTEIREIVPKKYREMGRVMRVALMVTMMIEAMKPGFPAP